MSSKLNEVIPFCCIVFKRHKVFKCNSEKLGKFWFYCKIEGCKLKGMAILTSDYSLDIINENTHLKHIKGTAKSYLSRPVREHNRKVLGERAVDMTYPSKLSHRKLASLDEDLFKMGNLKDVPQSKNVVKQCAYEYPKGNREDNSIITSLQLLKAKYIKDMSSKSLSGFVQFLSFDPITVGLWCHKDIQFFHEMVRSHSMVVDAPGSVSIKVKEILYFSFLFYNRFLQIEPVPHLEILTDQQLPPAFIPGR